MAEKAGGNLVYFATGIPSDPEMRERIGKHQRDRETGNYQWITIEQPIEIGRRAEKFTKQDIVLLDCVTTLLNNELFTAEELWDSTFQESILVRILEGIMSIKNHTKAMIVVSNEVVYEPLNENELVMTYGRLLGFIHRQLVKAADKAYLIESGIPIIMKGLKP